MKNFFILTLFLINNLFAISLNEKDLKTLKELDLDSSFVNETSFKNNFKKYSKNKIRYYDTLFKKSPLNVELVRKEIEKEGLPKAMFFLPLVESSFINENEEKNIPAGLWQIMPQTAKKLNLRVDDFIDERLDLIRSTDAASSYLKKNHRKFDKWYLAILAYNAGDGRVIEGLSRASFDRYLEMNPDKKNTTTIKLYKKYLDEYSKNRKGINDLYTVFENIGIKEKGYDFIYLLKNNKERSYIPQTTVNYIQKIVIFSMITNRDLFKNINVKAKYELVNVKAHKGLQLNSIAEIINMNPSEFKKINQHIKKENLPTDLKLYNIYIPKNKLELYNKKIVNLKPIKEEFNKKVIIKENISSEKTEKKKKNEVIIYYVKKGDSLSLIAYKYKVKLKKLKADNNKKSDLIKIGEKIEIYK